MILLSRNNLLNQGRMFILQFLLLSSVSVDVVVGQTSPLRMLCVSDMRFGMNHFPDCEQHRAPVLDLMGECAHAAVAAAGIDAGIDQPADFLPVPQISSLRRSLSQQGMGDDKQDENTRIEEEMEYTRQLVAKLDICERCLNEQSTDLNKMACCEMCPFFFCGMPPDMPEHPERHRRRHLQQDNYSNDDNKVEEDGSDQQTQQAGVDLGREQHTGQGQEYGTTLEREQQPQEKLHRRRELSSSDSSNSEKSAKNVFEEEIEKLIESDDGTLGLEIKTFTVMDYDDDDEDLDEGKVKEISILTVPNGATVPPDAAIEYITVTIPVYKEKITGPVTAAPVTPAPATPAPITSSPVTQAPISALSDKLWFDEDCTEKRDMCYPGLICRELSESHAKCVIGPDYCPETDLPEPDKKKFEGEECTGQMESCCPGLLCVGDEHYAKCLRDKEGLGGIFGDIDPDSQSTGSSSGEINYEVAINLQTAKIDWYLEGYDINFADHISVNSAREYFQDVLEAIRTECTARFKKYAEENDDDSEKCFGDRTLAQCYPFYIFK